MLVLRLLLQCHGQLSAHTGHLCLPLEREGLELLAIVEVGLVDFLTVLQFEVVLNGLLGVLPNLSDVVEVFKFCCVSSCFETVTHHISGRPFCTMSTEALEMIVKHSKNPAT